MTELTLGFGLAFTDLYENAGLEKLDRRFVEWLREADGDLASRLLAARALPETVSCRWRREPAADRPGARSGRFHRTSCSESVRRLRQLAARHEALTPLYAAKRLFVQRRAAKAFRPEQAAGWTGGC